jgi:hypothetical protein
MQKAVPKHRLADRYLTDPARERVEEECSSGLYRSGCEPGREEEFRTAIQYERVVL